jgi:hypothetical protein
MFQLRVEIAHKEMNKIYLEEKYMNWRGKLSKLCNQLQRKSQKLCGKIVIFHSPMASLKIKYIEDQL